MSKKNRKMVYDKLLKEGRLDRDDGSLVKEFGFSGTPAKKEEPKYEDNLNENECPEEEPKKKKK